MSMIKLYLRWLLVGILILGCEDEGVEPDPTNSSITGFVSYLDGTVGAYSSIQLRKVSSSILKYANADVNGIYKFDSLSSGDYVLRFRSNSEDINSYEIEISLKKSQTYEQNLYVLYKKIDEFNALRKSTDVFLIKYHPEGGKIGSNYELVDYLGGTFIRDPSSIYTLSSDIYLLPDTLDWAASDSLFTPDYVRNNYEFVTSIEEINFGINHEIRFYGDDIVKILSNPSNGFIFIKKFEDGKELKVPCIDMINNDFGLLIYYKQ